MTSFVEFVTSERKQQKVSRHKLAQLAGVSNGSLCAYEAGAEPSIEKAHRILSALGVSMIIGAGGVKYVGKSNVPR